MKEIKHQDHLDNMARQGTPVRANNLSALPAETVAAMISELEWLYQKYRHGSTRLVLTKAKGIV